MIIWQPWPPEPVLRPWSPRWQRNWQPAGAEAGNAAIRVRPNRGPARRLPGWVLQIGLLAGETTWTRVRNAAAAARSEVTLWSHERDSLAAPLLNQGSRANSTVESSWQLPAGRSNRRHSNEIRRGKRQMRRRRRASCINLPAGPTWPTFNAYEAGRGVDRSVNFWADRTEGSANMGQKSGWVKETAE